MENATGKEDYDFSMNLPNRLFLMLKSGEWSDCSFAVGTEPDIKVFNAHKMLLSAASPVFRAMFNSGLEAKSPVKIVDIRPDIFQLLLDFIYTDCVMFAAHEQARDVCYAADKYIMPKLIEECEKRMLQMLGDDNACEAYEIAKRFDRVELMQRSLKRISERTYYILQSPSFVKVQLSTLLMILNADKLNFGFHDRRGVSKTAHSEFYFFNAIMKWGIAECKRKEIPEDMVNVRNVIDPALKKIRFLNMGEFFLKEITKTWAIFTEDEKSAILQGISYPTIRPLMPLGFSTSRVHRAPK